MISHIFIGIDDFNKSYTFYFQLMQTLGIEQRFYDDTKPWAGWHNSDGNRPLLVIGKPFDGQPHHAGNGQMIAFLANDRSTVDKAYDIALDNFGTDEGKPGLRPQYHPDYYGAYFRDPDGNKLCVVCHKPA